MYKEQISKNRVKIYKKDVIVIMPKNWETSEKNCPVCKLTFRDTEDVDCFLEWGCCTDCRDQYAYHNADKWQNGWRPKIKK